MLLSLWMEMVDGLKRKMPRIKGHYEGMQTIKKLLEKRVILSIKYLTLYAFSTENWSRPESEVNYIMNLPVNFLKTFLPELIEKMLKSKRLGLIMDYLNPQLKQLIMPKTRQNIIQA